MKAKSIITFILIMSVASVYGQTNKDSLLVFVGEKIEVVAAPEEKKEESVRTVIKGNDTSYVKQVTIRMDSKYIAKYKVLQLINSSYSNDTIEFVVYDHYGEPAFAKYSTVLLFVSYYKGKLYHEKYQFFPLYLTTDNKWASPYSSEDYNHSYKDNITVKPEKISFKDKVSYEIDKFPSKNIETRFPKPYYKIKNGKAIAVYGNYVNELFILKQETILKARRIY
ncbi:hypothetical protein [Chondrinema litorale]|uniref:hypothetical protein n=1 Tax=Chondrinema litorale TaxID=2994555 RepID=UPI0025435CF3|nr:hypothetical protein [Chondrinema litorale]UZR99275.1 hypothetical protein OQ292_35425 [Chondrinema litorale]